MKEKNGSLWQFGKLKRSGATLAIAAVLLVFCVIGGSGGGLMNQNPVPALAKPISGAVYAISYRNLDTREGLYLLENDIGFFKKSGLGFILPDELQLRQGGMILIAEDGDPEALHALLEKNGAKAVFVMRESMTPQQERFALRCADKGIFALAAPFEQGCGPLDIFENIAASGKAAALRIGRTVGIFTAEVPEEWGMECLRGIGGETARTVVFLFGSGFNEPPFPKSGIVLLNRVMRLPEWTAEEFLSEIAVGENRGEK